MGQTGPDQAKRGNEAEIFQESLVGVLSDNRPIPRFGLFKR